MTAGHSNPSMTTAAARGAGTGAIPGIVTALVLVAPVALLYLALPLQNYSDAKDSLSYAFNIRNGTPAYHPNHLLYEPLNLLVHRLATALFGPIDTLRTMQLVSTLTAIPALLLICRIAQRWGNEILPGAVAVGAIAFSFGVWCYSISGDGYLPPLLLVLISMALLDPARWGKDGAVAPSMSLVLMAALATAAAVLVHQMYVFYAIITGVMMLWAPEFGPLAGRFRRFLVYCGVSGAIVVGTYVLVFVTVAPDGMGFFSWMRGYAANGLYYANPPSLLTFPLGGLGALTSMLTMNAFMSFDMVNDAALRWFPGKSMFEERYIAEVAIGRPMAWLIVVAIAVSVLSWLALAQRAGATALARYRAAVPMPFTDRLLLLLTVVFSLLVLLWEPINREFWIHVYVFATLYCAMNAGLHHRLARLAAVALCCALFVANFFGAIRPLSSPNADYWQVFHRQAFEGIMATDYDVALISCSYMCTNYLRYFHVGKVIVPSLDAPGRLQVEFAKYPAERILVSKWFLAPHVSFIDPATQRTADAKRYKPVLDEFLKAYPSALAAPLPDSPFYKFVGGKLVPAKN